MSTSQSSNAGEGAVFGLSDSVRLFLAVLFMLAVVGYSWYAFAHVSLTIVVAAAFGAYMAMNVGANDVANNVGPAVGAKAMKMSTAILVAAIFEAAGAVIAGGEVVGTVRSGIIDPVGIEDATTFIWLMMAALLAGALWLNLATALGAPVSTTHSIVGGVVGAGIAALGWDAVNWPRMGQIASSWVISPLMGGAIAAFFLYLIKRTITYRTDLTAASRTMVPILLALMAFAFANFLAVKGLGQLVKVSAVLALGIGAGTGVLVWLVSRAALAKRIAGMSNDKEGVNSLFGWPLVFAAALLSFAHGSNDVANAIGPLAAITSTIESAGVSASAAVPAWVMWVGALGLAVGLALYGPKLIRTVGSEITDMDHMRAYSIVMAATITVSIASDLGLPISTTHTTIGAVFGVGFLREYLKSRYRRAIEEIEQHHHHNGAEAAEVEAFLAAFESAPATEKTRMLKELKLAGKRGQSPISKSERKDLRRVHRKAIVTRKVMMRILAAWLITVPATGVLAAIVFFTIRGMMLPA